MLLTAPHDHTRLPLPLLLLIAVVAMSTAGPRGSHAQVVLHPPPRGGAASGGTSSSVSSGGEGGNGNNRFVAIGGVAGRFADAAPYNPQLAAGVFSSGVPSYPFGTVTGNGRAGFGTPVTLGGINSDAPGIAGYGGGPAAIVAAPGYRGVAAGGGAAYPRYETRYALDNVGAAPVLNDLSAYRPAASPHPLSDGSGNGGASGSGGGGGGSGGNAHNSQKTNGYDRTSPSVAPQSSPRLLPTSIPDVLAGIKAQRAAAEAAAAAAGAAGGKHSSALLPPEPPVQQAAKLGRPGEAVGSRDAPASRRGGFNLADGGGGGERIAHVRPPVDVTLAERGEPPQPALHYGNRQPVHHGEIAPQLEQYPEQRDYFGRFRSPLPQAFYLPDQQLLQQNLDQDYQQVENLRPQQPPQQQVQERQPKHRDQQPQKQQQQQQQRQQQQQGQAQHQKPLDQKQQQDEQQRLDELYPNRKVQFDDDDGGVTNPSSGSTARRPQLPPPSSAGFSAGGLPVFATGFGYRPVAHAPDQFVDQYQQTLQQGFQPVGQEYTTTSADPLQLYYRDQQLGASAGNAVGGLAESIYGAGSSEANGGVSRAISVGAGGGGFGGGVGGFGANAFGVLSNADFRAQFTSPLGALTAPSSQLSSLSSPLLQPQSLQSPQLAATGNAGYQLPVFAGSYGSLTGSSFRLQQQQQQQQQHQLLQHQPQAPLPQLFDEGRPRGGVIGTFAGRSIASGGTSNGSTSNGDAGSVPSIGVPFTTTGAAAAAATFDAATASGIHRTPAATASGNAQQRPTSSADGRGHQPVVHGEQRPPNRLPRHSPA